MPELPEVETVCAGLNKEIIGCVFTKIHIKRHDLRIPVPTNFVEQLEGKKILEIRRKGKYILLYLSDELILIIHLGMTGRITINYAHKAKTHDHAIFTLDDGREMVFNDTRRFGLITFCKQSELDHSKLFINQGIEPLETEFNSTYLLKILRKKTAPVKSVLMDSNVLLGVGNIYSNESLFRAKISPLRPSNKITEAEAKLLVKSIKQVLNEAIAAGGSSIKDYVGHNHQLGYFQHKFLVYNKGGKPCSICATPIIRSQIAGRSTFYCQTCQK